MFEVLFVSPCTEPLNGGFSRRSVESLPSVKLLYFIYRLAHLLEYFLKLCHEIN